MTLHLQARFISAMLLILPATMLLVVAQTALPEIVRLRPITPTPPQNTDPEPIAPSVGAQAAQNAPDLPPRAALVGEWYLGLAGRSTRCRLTLSAQSAAGGMLIAALGDNCPPSLFAVTRWRLTPTELVLANRSGQPLARLKPKDSATADSGWQGPTRDGPNALIEKTP